jgi:hypothetical protein
MQQPAGTNFTKDDPYSTARNYALIKDKINPPPATINCIEAANTYYITNNHYNTIPAAAAGLIDNYSISSSAVNVQHCLQMDDDRNSDHGRKVSIASTSDDHVTHNIATDLPSSTWLYSHGYVPDLEADPMSNQLLCQCSPMLHDINDQCQVLNHELYTGLINDDQLLYPVYEAATSNVHNPNQYDPLSSCFTSSPSSSSSICLDKVVHPDRSSLVVTDEPCQPEADADDQIAYSCQSDQGINPYTLLEILCCFNSFA